MRRRKANYFWSVATKQPMVNALTGARDPTDEVIVNDLESLYEFFKLIFTDALMELILEQTNLYASQYIAANHPSPLCTVRRWKDLTKDELCILLGLALLTGLLDKKGHVSLDNR